MKGRTVGILLLLVGSIVLGVIAGQVNWVLFQKAIPPTMVSELNQLTARGVASSYGLFTGVGFFIWGLLAALLAPAFRSRQKKEKDL